MYKETYLQLIADENEESLEKARVMSKYAKVGDIVFSEGEYAYVEQIIHWHPEDGGRPKCPIHPVWVAVQVKTDKGDRWWGYSLSDH